MNWKRWTQVCELGGQSMIDYTVTMHRNHEITDEERSRRLARCYQILIVLADQQGVDSEEPSGDPTSESLDKAAAVEIKNGPAPILAQCTERYS